MVRNPVPRQLAFFGADAPFPLPPRHDGTEQAPSCQRIRTPDAVCARPRSHRFFDAFVQRGEGRETPLLVFEAPETKLCTKKYGKAGSPQPYQEIGRAHV